MLPAALPLGWRHSLPPDLLSTPEHEFPRGRISEVVGPRSSGRTGVLHSILSASTQLGESAVLVDTCDAFDSSSASGAGVDLDQLIWIRCGGQVEHALRAADLVIQSGGFGVVALDLVGASSSGLARIPPTAWFRFRRAVETSPTVLLVLAEQSLTKSCAAYRVRLEQRKPVFTGAHPFLLLRDAG